MPKQSFLKYEGSYKEVSRNVGSSDFFKELGKQKYDIQVSEKDEKRTPYFNPFGTIETQKARLRDTSHLTEYKFTQGDFMGTGIAKCCILSQPSYPINMANASEEAEGTHKTMQQNIVISYIDDANRLCGVTINYLRDDSNLNISPDSRTCDFAVTIVRDVNQSIDKRQVTLWATQKIISDGNNDKVLAKGVSVAPDSLSTEIKTTLNSKLLEQGLRDIYKNEQFSLKEFNEFRARVVTNHNIDNRDLKAAQVAELFTIAKQFPSLSADVDKQQEEIKSNLDFYKDANYEISIKNLLSNIQVAIHSLPEPQSVTELSLCITLHESAIWQELAQSKAYNKPGKKLIEMKSRFYAGAYRQLLKNPADYNQSSKQQIDKKIEEDYQKYIDKTRIALIEKLEIAMIFDRTQIKALQNNKQNQALINAYKARAQTYDDIIHSLPTDDSVLLMSSLKPSNIVEEVHATQFETLRNNIKTDNEPSSMPDLPTHQNRMKILRNVGIVCAVLLLMGLGLALTATGAFAAIGIPLIAVSSMIGFTSAGFIAAESNHYNAALNHFNTSQKTLSQIEAKEKALQNQTQILAEHSNDITSKANLPNERQKNQIETSLEQSYEKAKEIKQELLSNASLTAPIKLDLQSRLETLIKKMELALSLLGDRKQKYKELQDDLPLFQQTLTVRSQRETTEPRLSPNKSSTAKIFNSPGLQPKSKSTKAAHIKQGATVESKQNSAVEEITYSTPMMA